jgi:hypothetical protein
MCSVSTRLRASSTSGTRHISTSRYAEVKRHETDQRLRRHCYPRALALDPPSVAWFVLQPATQISPSNHNHNQPGILVAHLATCPTAARQQTPTKARLAVVDRGNQSYQYTRTRAGQRISYLCPSCAEHANHVQRLNGVLVLHCNRGARDGKCGRKQAQKGEQVLYTQPQTRNLQWIPTQQ